MYLYGSVKRWYNIERNNITIWTEQFEPMAITFKYEFLVKFVIDRKKTSWIREFNQLKQDRKTIEEYIDEFTCLLQKVDPTRAWTEEMKKHKFIEGLNPKISSLVHM